MTQSQVAEAVEATTGLTTNRIATEGVDIDQLGLAITRLSPSHLLMAKYDSSVRDIGHLVDTCGLPVGVEWQGLFDKAEGGTYEIGHYALIVGIDPVAQVLALVDPDDDSVFGRRGNIMVTEFERRWWETDFNTARGDPIMPVRRREKLVFVLAHHEERATLEALGLYPAPQIWGRYR